jgi:hypothetical protein
MSRSIGWSLLAGSLVALALAAPAAAGGWAAVVDDEQLASGDDGATVVRFRLLQHGETPVDWGEVSVVAVGADGEERVTASAMPEAGQPGTWTASFQLPAAGTWTLEVHHQDLEVMTSHPIRVTASAPAMAPAPSSNAGPAAWLGLALVAVAILLPASAALVLVRRAPAATLARQRL